jgi:hypothetical protein
MTDYAEQRGPYLLIVYKGIVDFPGNSNDI